MTWLSIVLECIFLRNRRKSLFWTLLMWDEVEDFIKLLYYSPPRIGYFVRVVSPIHGLVPHVSAEPRTVVVLFVLRLSMSDSIEPAKFKRVCLTSAMTLIRWNEWFLLCSTCSESYNKRWRDAIRFKRYWFLALTVFVLLKAVIIYVCGCYKKLCLKNWKIIEIYLLHYHVVVVVVIIV